MRNRRPPLVQRSATVISRSLVIRPWHGAAQSWTLGRRTMLTSRGPPHHLAHRLSPAAALSGGPVCAPSRKRECEAMRIELRPVAGNDFSHVKPTADLIL